MLDNEGAMQRILIAECIHEVSSFNPVPTRYDAFSIQRGSALFDNHRSLGIEVGCHRPIFPLDGDVPFTPQVRLFARRSNP